MSPIVVPTGATPSVVEFIGKIRTDLFDAGQRAGEQPRWLDSDLARALDRANDKYSATAPYLKQELIPTIAGSRLYASPSDCWWIDTAEYPYGQWPKWYQNFAESLTPYIPEPAAGGAVVSVEAGTAFTGPQTWYIAFIAPGGGTTIPVPIASIDVPPPVACSALLAGIPTGPYGVIDRAIYRGTPTSTPRLVANLGDNTTTTFLDQVPD